MNNEKLFDIFTRSDWRQFLLNQNIIYEINRILKEDYEGWEIMLTQITKYGKNYSGETFCNKKRLGGYVFDETLPYAVMKAYKKLAPEEVTNFQETKDFQHWYTSITSQL